MSSQWVKRVTAVAVVGLCAGCGAGAGGDEFSVGDEEAMGGEAVGVAREALAVGCAATVVTSENHTGWLYSSPSSIFIDRLEYRISNPSAMDCATMLITFRLKDDLYGTTLRESSITTSLRAGYSRSVYSNGNYETSAYWVDAMLLRNGNSIKLTYMPGYFRNTGQY